MEMPRGRYKPGTKIVTFIDISPQANAKNLDANYAKLRD
jgi:hypothetical protein